MVVEWMVAGAAVAMPKSLCVAVAANTYRSRKLQSDNEESCNRKEDLVDDGEEHASFTFYEKNIDRKPYWEEEYGQEVQHDEELIANVVKLCPDVKKPDGETPIKRGLLRSLISRREITEDSETSISYFSESEREEDGPVNLSRDDVLETIAERADSFGYKYSKKELDAVKENFREILYSPE